jgi:hypothetical protein
MTRCMCPFDTSRSDANSSGVSVAFGSGTLGRSHRARWTVFCTLAAKSGKASFVRSPRKDNCNDAEAEHHQRGQAYEIDKADWHPAGREGSGGGSGVPCRHRRADAGEGHWAAQLGHPLDRDGNKFQPGYRSACLALAKVPLGTFPIAPPLRLLAG